MLRYSDKTLTPPGGGYPYRQPESGFPFKQVSFSDLVKEVKDHRKANNFPIGPNFEAEVEDASCRELLQMFPNYEGCLDETGDKAVYKGRKWGLADVRHFLNTMSGWIAKGAKFVSQEEANRRAEICSRCPMNVQLAECLGCSNVSGMVNTIRGSRRTSVEDRLRTCSGCGCQLAVKVWMPKDVMQRDGVEYHPSCWMLE
jgi:hypothetical protein